MFKSNFLVQDFRAVLSMLHLFSTSDFRLLLLPVPSRLCVHKLSFLRRRTVSVTTPPLLAAPPEPSRLRARTSSRCCGVVGDVARVSVLAARLRALLLEWRHRTLCLTPPSPLVATFIIKNSRTSADTSARARCIGQTTERGGSGELLRSMFHNHCHASNRRIHQAPVCDKCQIARF